MKDKFRENFKIALPAAVITLAVILIISLNTPIRPFPIIKEYNLDVYKRQAIRRPFPPTMMPSPRMWTAPKSPTAVRS